MTSAVREQVSVHDIFVPDRLREVDNGIVAAMSKSVELNGLLNPITVRRTPNGEAKLTLVAGAHRLMAVKVLAEELIEVNIVSADAETAALIEIEENLFRNDLTALDRAIFVEAYRARWEAQRGEIKRGGDQRTKLDLCPTDALNELAGNGFTEACAERLGISKTGVKRAQRIAAGLPADFRREITGTSLADNQSALLKLADLEPSRRKRLAAAFKKAEGDEGAFMEALFTKPKQASADQKQFEQLVSAWTRANPDVRIRFANEFSGELMGAAVRADLMPRREDDDG